MEMLKLALLECIGNFQDFFRKGQRADMDKDVSIGYTACALLIMPAIGLIFLAGKVFTGALEISVLGAVIMAWILMCAVFLSWGLTKRTFYANIAALAFLLLSLFWFSYEGGVLKGRFTIWAIKYGAEYDSRADAQNAFLEGLERAKSRAEWLRELEAIAKEQKAARPGNFSLDII